MMYTDAPGLIFFAKEILAVACSNQIDVYFSRAGEKMEILKIRTLTAETIFFLVPVHTLIFNNKIIGSSH